MPAARIQPQGRVRINRSNAFGKRTKFAYVAGQSRDVAGGLAATNNGATLATGQNGIALRTGTTQGTFNSLDFPVITINSAFSFLVRVKRNGPSSANYDQIAGTVNSGGNPYFGFLVEPSGNRPYFEIRSGGTTVGAGGGSSSALSTSDYETLLAVNDGTALTMYRNGQLYATGTSPGFPGNSALNLFKLGHDSRPYQSGLSCDISECYILDGALSASEALALSNAPYQILEGQAPMLYAAAAGGSVSGSITWTEASDSAAAAGSVTVSGAASWTEAADSAALAGSVGSAVSINAAWTEVADSVAIASTARVNAAAAWTEAADSISIAGSAGNSVAANISWTEAADVTTVAGTIRINAAGSWTEAGDTAAIVVNVAAAQSAALSWTEAPDGIAIAANVVAAPVVGAIAWTEAADISAVASYPKFYAFTMMRADPVSASGFMQGSSAQFTLMRSNPLYAASAMSDAPLNRSVNLI